MGRSKQVEDHAWGREDLLFPATPWGRERLFKNDRSIVGMEGRGPEYELPLVAVKLGPKGEANLALGRGNIDAYNLNKKLD